MFLVILCFKAAWSKNPVGPHQAGWLFSEPNQTLGLLFTLFLIILGGEGKSERKLHCAL